MFSGHRAQTIDELRAELHSFKSGAQSSERLPAYHLIPWEAFVDRLAARYELGAMKYGPNNWQKGLQDPEFLLDRANHMLRHAFLAVADLQCNGPGHSKNDDDLAAVLWGAICLMMAQRMQRTSEPKEASS